PDVGAQVLLGSTLYALWLCFEMVIQSQKQPYRRPETGEALRNSDAWKAGTLLRAGISALRKDRRIRGSVVRLTIGWALGFLLAAPYLLPVLDYSKDGSRMARRGAGEEERPPIGLSALPQVLLPDMYGTTQAGVVRFAAGHQAESSAAAYAGLLAALLAAPLAFCSRRHRLVNLFLILLAFFGLAWCLNIPGLVSLLRLPGLNMMSHNRLVFLSSFAILALAVIGLEVLGQNLVTWRRWLLLPSGVLVCLCLWNLFRTLRLPEPIRIQLPAMVAQGKEVGN